MDKTGITDTFKPLNEDRSHRPGEVRHRHLGNPHFLGRTQQYRGNSVTVNVPTTDNRIASSVALHTGVSFTYNMDPAVMKQAIFDSVIDWTNSILPAKETLDLDDFVIEYKAKLTDAETGVDVDLGDIPGLGDLISSDKLTQWVPLEGKVYKLGDHGPGRVPPDRRGGEPADLRQLQGQWPTTVPARPPRDRHREQGQGQREGQLHQYLRR